MARRQRAWCATLNNPTKAEEAALLAFLDLLESRGGRAVVGREVAESGTPHLQAYLEMPHAKTLSATKKALGSDRYHLETRRGTAFEAWTYCVKDGNVLAAVGLAPTEDEDPSDSWAMALRMLEEGGTVLDVLRRWPGHVRAIGALERVKAELEMARPREWRDITTTYVWGPPGVGKSRGVFESEGGYDGEVYRITSDRNPWDGYRGEPVVMFEEFRSSFPIETMLNWLDGYPLALPCRYQDRPARFVRVYLVTNIPLEEQYVGVQANHPETWAAFRRRITGVVHLEASD